jgi:hypothetical protein
MRLAAFTTIVVAVVGLAAYDQYDKHTHYQPVDARVSAVSDQCFMEKTESGAVIKTTYTSDLLDCERAELLTREHPKWQGYAIRHKIEIRFSYVSPVDRAYHAASLTMSAFPKGHPLRTGDVVRVLASKTKAEKIREI